MPRQPTLRGRYDGKVLSPLQRGLLFTIAFVFLMAFQIDELLTTSFRIALFGHDVIRVEHPRPGPQATAYRTILTLTPEDWPAPPMPTSWPLTRPSGQEPLIIHSEATDGELLIPKDLSEFPPPPPEPRSLLVFN